MVPEKSATGIALAFVCLMILGVMPIIAGGRPKEFDAVSFAFFLSIWQLVFSLPLMLWQVRAGTKGIFAAHLTPQLRRRTILIILATGALFGFATFAYVVAVDKAGPVNAAIAIQAYPLFSILWETLFLKRPKTTLELAFTLLLITALYYLATGGTWVVQGLSPWFLFAFLVPFLWSVAHVVIREVLTRTPITPAQVTFVRVLISALLLGTIFAAVSGLARIGADLINPQFQLFASVMGLVYFLELISWFHAVRTIDVSTAGSITIPAPAVTMALAILILGQPVAGYQVAALAVVVGSIYGLLYAGARKRRAAEGVRAST